MWANLASQGITFRLFFQAIQWHFNQTFIGSNDPVIHPMWCPNDLTRYQLLAIVCAKSVCEYATKLALANFKFTHSHILSNTFTHQQILRYFLMCECVAQDMWMCEFKIGECEFGYRFTHRFCTHNLCVFVTYGPS